MSSWSKFWGRAASCEQDNCAHGGGRGYLVHSQSRLLAVLEFRRRHCRRFFDAVELLCMTSGVENNFARRGFLRKLGQKALPGKTSSKLSTRCGRGHRGVVWKVELHGTSMHILFSPFHLHRNCALHVVRAPASRISRQVGSGRRDTFNGRPHPTACPVASPHASETSETNTSLER